MATNDYPMESPRKTMASGGGMPGVGNDFGVSKIPGGVPSVAHMDRDLSHDEMDESRRSPPLSHPDGKKLRLQQNHDHGPHHMNAAVPAGGSRAMSRRQRRM